MSTDTDSDREATDGDTGDQQTGTSDTSRSEQRTHTGADSPERRPPRIEDDSGTADEWFARLILFSPFLAFILAAIGFTALALTGRLTFDVTIDGTVSITPFVYGIAILVGLSYVLAAAKEWGIAPVAWISSAARDYRPRDDDE